MGGSNPFDGWSTAKDPVRIVVKKLRGLARGQIANPPRVIGTILRLGLRAVMEVLAPDPVGLGANQRSCASHHSPRRTRLMLRSHAPALRRFPAARGVTVPSA
jgi:hypothetical protein